MDLHTSHEVWSIVFVTSWKSLPRIRCRSCGVKRQVAGLFFSLLAGWWGVPWGFLVTPVQGFRNVASLARPPDPMRPSDALVAQLRLLLAEQRVAAEAEKPEAPA